MYGALLTEHTVYINLGRLPNEDWQPNGVLKRLFSGVVEIVQPEVEDFLLRLVVLRRRRPEPFDQRNVADGRLEIPVGRLEAEHALGSLEGRKR